MRTIKFRAWDGKKMIHDPKIGFVEGNYDYSINSEFSDPVERREYMQFTGLHDDKSGKPIYEGDIVKGEGSEGEYMAPVIYENCKFTIDPFKARQIKNVDKWNYEHDQVKTRGFLIHWGIDGYHNLKTGWKNIEVIGNIYQDSHLLEDKV